MTQVPLTDDVLTVLDADTAASGISRAELLARLARLYSRQNNVVRAWWRGHLPVELLADTDALHKMIDASAGK
jgi:hypothetical protein